MKTLAFQAAAAALALGAAACTPDKALEAANTGSTRPAVADAGADSGAAQGPALPALPKMEFAENDFAESDRNRDPFRTYVSVIGPEVKKVANVQKEVILSQFSLDELKLVAIVTGGEYPRAMVVDPAGKGWVIKRGDWVGRPEVVHIGGANGTDYQINWRVNKVRDGDIVFTREDPAQPGIPPASRVIALRTESEQPRDRL
ncbi:MAG: pilus assembly protein PilP [Labilithrix sp.]|nr:pilus assembly protein PilP [Labilithrix sp.]